MKNIFIKLSFKAFLKVCFYPYYYILYIIHISYFETCVINLCKLQQYKLIKLYLFTFSTTYFFYTFYLRAEKKTFSPQTSLVIKV